MFMKFLGGVGFGTWSNCILGLIWIQEQFFHFSNMGDITPTQYKYIMVT